MVLTLENSFHMVSQKVLNFLKCNLVRLKHLLSSISLCVIHELFNFNKMNDYSKVYSHTHTYRVFIRILILYCTL